MTPTTKSGVRWPGRRGSLLAVSLLATSLLATARPAPAMTSAVQAELDAAPHRADIGVGRPASVVERAVVGVDRSAESVLPNALTNGPGLGALTDTGVKVWGRASRPGLLQVEIDGSEPGAANRMFGPVPLTADTDFTGVVPVDGLTPATAYSYRTLLDGQPVGSGSFRTLPASGQPGVFRFTIGGDLDQRFGPFSILGQMGRQGAAFGILLGDLVYADQPTMPEATAEAYRARYRTTWADGAFRRLTANTPLFTMWDDHEIANDYDGSDPQRYQAARTALLDYAARSNPAPRRADALYYTFQVADADFFVLDTRSYRSRNTQPDGPDKSMLGQEQKSELKRWLLASHAPVKFVLSSVPLHELAAGRPDDWNVFATERTELLEFIRDHDIAGVVFLTGDQHWSSLVNHEAYGVWEFNATPLAQGVRAEPRRDDPRLVLAYTESAAFGVVDVDTRGGTPQVTFSVVDGDGQVRATHTVPALAPSARASTGGSTAR